MKLLLPRVMKRGALRQKLELLGTDLREREQIARLDNSYDRDAQVFAAALDAAVLRAVAQKLLNEIRITRHRWSKKRWAGGPNAEPCKKGIETPVRLC